METTAGPQYNFSPECPCHHFGWVLVISEAISGTECLPFISVCFNTSENSDEVPKKD